MDSFINSNDTGVPPFKNFCILRPGFKGNQLNLPFRYFYDHIIIFSHIYR